MNATYPRDNSRLSSYMICPSVVALLLASPFIFQPLKLGLFAAMVKRRDLRLTVDLSGTNADDQDREASRRKPGTNSQSLSLFDSKEPKRFET
jgi:hypothetical protein